MPIFLDRHEQLDVAPEDLQKAHLADLEAQEKYGVHYLSYWFDYEAQKAYCLVDAPSPEAAEAVHEEAHGVMANKMIPVDPAELWKYMGGGRVGDLPAFDPYGQNAQTVRIIVFTDIVDSSLAAAQFGDDAAMTRLHDHNRIVREHLERQQGREVKHTGDGIMASFVSVSGAIACSLAVQSALIERNAQADENKLEVRIGLAAGEPVAEDDDLFGTAVNLAARVCGVAEPGSVFVTDGVRDLAMGKNFAFEDVAELDLKGFPRPIRVSRVVR